MFKGIVKIITNLASYIQKKVETVFKRFGKDATGQTIRSLRQAVDLDIEKGFEIDIYGSKVFDYIEDGRPAGSKLPPQGALIDWMQARGIAIENEFVIRRAIAVNGIAPTPIIETSFNEIVQEFDNKIAPSLLKGIANSIKQAIKKGFKMGE